MQPMPVPKDCPCDAEQVAEARANRLAPRSARSQITIFRKQVDHLTDCEETDHDDDEADAALHFGNAEAEAGLTAKRIDSDRADRNPERERDHRDDRLIAGDGDHAEEAQNGCCEELRLRELESQRRKGCGQDRGDQRAHEATPRGGGDRDGERPLRLAPPGHRIAVPCGGQRGRRSGHVDQKLRKSTRRRRRPHRCRRETASIASATSRR